MGDKGGTWKKDSFDKVLRLEEHLDFSSTTLITAVLESHCRGKAEVALRKFKAIPDTPTTFAEMFNYLGRSWDKADKAESQTRGWILMQKLIHMKFQVGNAINAYNREYMAFFEELISSGYIENGVTAVRGCCGAHRQGYGGYRPHGLE